MVDVEFLKARAFHVEPILARWKQVEGDESVLVRLPRAERALPQISERHFGAEHDRRARIDDRNRQRRRVLCEGGETAKRQSHSRNLPDYHQRFPPKSRVPAPKAV